MIRKGGADWLRPRGGQTVWQDERARGKVQSPHQETWLSLWGIPLALVAGVVFWTALICMVMGGGR